MPAIHADDEEPMNDQPPFWLKLVLESQERQSKAQAGAIKELAGEVRELRSDVARLAPPPKLIIGAAGSVVLGFLTVAVLAIILMASGKGIDVTEAADATKVVVGAATVVAEPAPPYAPPVEPPTVPASPTSNP